MNSMGYNPPRATRYSTWGTLSFSYPPPIWGTNLRPRLVGMNSTGESMLCRYPTRDMQLSYTSAAIASWGGDLYYLWLAHH